VNAQSAAQSIDGAWRGSVASWLVAHKSYPEEARQRGEEGRVVVRFTVDRSGHVIDAAIVGGSGSERLDAATLALLRAAILPAFPPSMTQARTTITTSMRYSLR
jgi:protein TonB